MIVGIDNAIKFVKLNGHVGFRVKPDMQGETFLFSSEPGESLDKAIDRFRQIMDIYEGSSSKFYLEAWPAEGSKKGWSKDWFKLDAGSAPPVTGISGVPATTGVSEKYLEERIAGVRKEVETDFELRRMKEELAELKEENKELTRRHESAWEQLIQRASPYIGYIIQAVIPKTAQIGLAGIEPNPAIFNPQENTTEEMNDINESTQTPEELSAIIAELSELEPELPRILTGLLAFVKEKQLTYKTMVRPQLMEFLSIND
jgi:hypothetical protein